MKILVISPHPDDETLGCGGTLLRHKAEGAELNWIVVTETYAPKWSADLVERKAKEVDDVGKAYGMHKVRKLGFPTIQLGEISLSVLMDKIREAIEEICPETVYLVHAGDVHTDHHAVFTATMSVLKTFYMSKMGVKRILCFETLSSTEAAPALSHRLFIPNMYSDITPYIEDKIAIMGKYETEAQPDPFPRGFSAIRALARYRGASIGVDYAEAFMLIREIF